MSTETKPEPTQEQQAIMILGRRIEFLENALLNLSQALAEKEHGPEAVQAAQIAAGESLHKFMQDPHPYDSLVDWHQTAGRHSL